ncbi:hypothetical protein AMS68_002122 [Peltaster fructicola]|uniref:F-box domain-containing protein n=1 Tax=Peltaster fructicola TaxID=286661 RepID=A0A6H0XPP5_9PEZI|nr:hypothetical protein AMS68_002122 [Peltaster fructicola]
MYTIPTSKKRSLDEGYRTSEIPRFVQYTTPIIAPPSNPSQAANLPLKILVHIISYLDDRGDIARVTRTCRLLCYMTLPQLYERVTLKSYAELRCKNGRPEGFGGGSPFSMALNGLVTRNNANLVKHFKVEGEWNEAGDEEYAKGRIPDSTVMLNTLLRIAVDRMTRLESFDWELTTKPLLSLYQGLSAQQSLTSLTIRFPSTRTPRPAIVLPAMPNLRAFRILEYDPLCHPDDASLLIFGSRKLVDLRIHFSPRMRSHAEPTISLDPLFGRCFKAGYTPKLQHFAMQNFFGRRLSWMGQIYDNTTCKSAAYLDVFGGARTGSHTVYIDDTWRDLPDEIVNTCTKLRFNEPAVQHVKMLENATTTLEHFYCVNDHPRTGSRVGTPATIVTPDPSPDDTAHTNPELIALGKEYLYVLTRKHGATLKHLLMCDQWALSQQEIGDVVRLCPQLTQLAVALDGPAFEVFRIIVQFLQNLEAIRIFENDAFRAHRDVMSGQEKLLFMGRDFYRLDMHKIRYVGAGREIFELLGNREYVHADGTTEMIRDMRELTLEEVQHVEIWGMDKFDIMLDAPILGAAG